MNKIILLENSIKHSLRKKELRKVLNCEEEFILSKRGCALVKKVVLGKKPDGLYFGSDLQSRILHIAAKFEDVAVGDWIWNAMAKCYGVTDEEIVARPPNSIPPRLPKYICKDSHPT